MSSGTATGFSSSSSAAPQRLPELGRLGVALAPGAGAQLLDEKTGCGDADVGAQQHGFEFLVERFVELAARAEQAREPLPELLARLGETLFEAREPARRIRRCRRGA